MKRNIYIYSFTFVIAVFLWLYLALNSNFNLTMEIPLDIKLSTAHSIVGNVPDTLRVNLNGRGWDLVGIMLSRGLVYSVDLSSIQRDVRLSVFQQVNERLGIPYTVRVLSVDPDTIYVAFGQVVQKKVPVRSNVTVEPRAGYTIVGAPRIIPDTIIITGSAEDVAGINFISTEQKVFRNVGEKLIAEVKLVSDTKGKAKMEPQEVIVEYDIELSAEKAFEEIEIEIRNVPLDKEVLLIPPQITVSLRGGVDQLSDLIPSDIIIYVNYDVIEQDTLGYVIPRIEVPGNPNILEISPDRFQYIIKNK